MGSASSRCDVMWLGNMSGNISCICCIALCRGVSFTATLNNCTSLSLVLFVLEDERDGAVAEVLAADLAVAVAVADGLASFSSMMETSSNSCEFSTRRRLNPLTRD